MVSHYKVTGQCNSLLLKDDPNYCPAQCCFILDYQPHGPWKCTYLDDNNLCKLQRMGRKPYRCAAFPDDDTIEALNIGLNGELEQKGWNITKIWLKCGYRIEKIE